MKLLLATRNAGKLRELRARVHGIDVVSLDDVAPMPEVEETEETLDGNARLKAVAGALGTGLWTVADDSGLFVDALGGSPGVRSARYAPGSDADRVRVLLEALDKVPDDERGASFRCVLALASPELGYLTSPFVFAPLGAPLVLHTHTALSAFAGATLLAVARRYFGHDVEADQQPLRREGRRARGAGARRPGGHRRTAHAGPARR